jgi:hypothetical protein
MGRALIIDCDPGVDDAIALLLALASPELEVLGITTVAGNVGGALTARNARLIRQIAGRQDVPVFAGCERPDGAGADRGGPLPWGERAGVAPRVRARGAAGGRAMRWTSWCAR